MKAQRNMMDGSKPTETNRPIHAPDGHPAIAQGRVGVLLVNLGTPDAPEAGAVRRYLREFLSDQRIVDLPRAIWLPVLYGIILNVRPAATARNYKKIWREESDESPLRYYTRAQSDALAAQFEGAVIDWAMRYGNPSIESRLDAMTAQGCTRILIVPLYPQYSATTTASVTDAVFDAAKAMRWQPAIRVAPAFHDEPAYIDALAAETERHFNTLDWKPERVIMSFHGLPQRYFDAGDPYHCHCAKTARLLREKMGWTDEFAPLAFQSKFGREKWLEPATDATIEELAQAGVKNLAVIMPGFVSDCIETLEEIDISGREIFMATGGQNFTAVPCLNDTPEMTALLTAITERETAGWL
ncbi:ferrochelatase [Hyphococcus flavus]|uniref:Ferrochelatase n=1 Tax=Hyphococcus flavus TaxID=1866326 RepID=A0AAE9ZDE0_9PROT|nr:ferrochelatase [Hyphococcus flavus]WDI32689.1 ferrochelatase [Hyphococcus flavus]